VPNKGGQQRGARQRCGEGRLLERGIYWRGKIIGFGCLLEMGAYWRGGAIIGEGHLLESGIYWRGALIEEG
jgi:hypothetical protein